MRAPRARADFEDTALDDRAARQVLDAVHWAVVLRKFQEMGRVITIEEAVAKYKIDDMILVSRNSEPQPPKNTPTHCRRRSRAR